MIPIICVKQWCYKGVLWKRIWQANTPLDIWAPIVKWLYIIGITSPSQNGIISHLNFSTGSDVVNFCLWGYFIWFYISQANYVIATFVMQCCVVFCYMWCLNLQLKMTLFSTQDVCFIEMNVIDMKRGYLNWAMVSVQIEMA